MSRHELRKHFDPQHTGRQQPQQYLPCSKRPNYAQPNRDPATQDASPLLIYIVAVLALLLAVLEADLHHELLQSFGLHGDPSGITPIFMSP